MVNICAKNYSAGARGFWAVTKSIILWVSKTALMGLNVIFMDFFHQKSATFWTFSERFFSIKIYEIFIRSLFGHLLVTQRPYKKSKRPKIQQSATFFKKLPKANRFYENCKLAMTNPQIMPIIIGSNLKKIGWLIKISQTRNYFAPKISGLCHFFGNSPPF